MKKRMLSLLLCLVMIFALLPTFTLPVRAEDTDEQNISNTSTDDLSTLGFDTDASEVKADAAPGNSPTGVGAFALRTQPELLIASNQSYTVQKSSPIGTIAAGTALFDCGASPAALDFNHGGSSSMENWQTWLLKNTTAKGKYATGINDYDFIKSVAFDPTGSGKADHVAYVCGKASGFTTTFTLYAVNIDGTYEIYPLGTAPFTIAQLHADSYMPIAAGDFDGDGYDELAVYCFGDSTAAAQWGSSDNTGKPVYQTDVDGNAIDKQNRRIDADGYLIAVLNDSLTWRRIAMESTAEATYYLDTGDYLIDGAGQHIDADGTVLEAGAAPVTGRPVRGEAVSYAQAANDDENLDVRVLDVDKDTLAITRHVLQTTGSTTRYADYDLGTLGYSKSSAVTPNNDGQSLANKKLYPVVDLSAIEQPGDQYDDLVICVSRALYSGGTTQDTATRIVFWTDPGYELTNAFKTFVGSWNYAADYGLSDQTSAETMFFGGAGTANLDGDGEGYREVVVAGYRCLNTSTTLAAGNAECYRISREAKINYYLAATYSYDAAAKTYVSDGPATWINNDCDTYGGATNMCKEVLSANSSAYVLQPTLEVLGFAEKGAGYADSVFVNGFVCDYYLNEGSAGTLPYGPSDDLRNNAFSKRKGKFLFSSYAVPIDYVMYGNTTRDERDDLDDNVTFRWIGDAVAGNFDGDASGVEELIFTYMCTIDQSARTSCAVIAAHKVKPGKFTDSKLIENLYNNKLEINEDSELYDRKGTKGAYFYGYSFTADDLWWSKNSGNDQNHAGCLTAVDWDDDAILAMPDPEKDPEYYFSDPYVVAVMQSAPYFEELSADYDFYPANGSTSIEKEKGQSNGVSQGFEVSAAAILGVKVEQSVGLIVNITVAEQEFKNSIGLNLTTEYAHDWEKSYSTAYSGSVGTDMVVLTMTPYVRYHYKTWDGKNWGEMTLDMPKTPRTTMVSVETYDRVAEASGWDVIRGNVLTSTPGDPYSYNTSSAGLSGFDGGKTIGGSSGNNWVGVGSGGTSSVGNITQSISSTETDSYAVSIGFTYEMEATETISGATFGFSAGFSSTTGYSGATFTGTSFSGTVDNLPQAAATGYDFLWRFGCWEDTLRYTNTDGRTAKRNVYVLGYLVKDVESLPKPPQDLAVVNFTENSITLEWSHPDKLPLYYIIYREEAGGFVPLRTVRADKTGDTQQYTDDTCESGTSYTYCIQSVNYINGFETTGPNSPPATGQTLSSGVPKVRITELVTAEAGKEAVFTAEVTPVAGGGTVAVQWQKWNGSRYVNLNGETGLNYTIPRAALEQSGSRYRCFVTQIINGRWCVGYSTYGLLTVTDHATVTALAELNPTSGTCYSFNANGTKVSGTTFPLSATVTEKNGTDTPTGAVAFELTNRSTGARYTVTGVLNSSGVAAASFEPGDAGEYTVVASYRGDGIFAASASSERGFLAYNQNGSILAITGKDEITYGETLALGAKLLNQDGTETPVQARVTYKVTDGTTSGAEILWHTLSGSSFDPVAVSRALHQSRNYVAAAGGYIVQATYTDGTTTYTATKNIEVNKATLTVTPGNVTMKLDSIHEDYLTGAAPSFSGFINYKDDGATVSQYKALFALYTDLPYTGLYVGSHAIRLRCAEAPAEAAALTTYKLFLSQLLANYNIVLKTGTFTVTDDWYTVTYTVADGKGSLDARTASRAVLPSTSAVLKGTRLTFAAAPAVGYEVESWDVTGSELSSLSGAAEIPASQSGAITANTTVRVSFAAGYPTLRWSVSGGHGGLTGSAGQTVITSPAQVSTQGVYTLAAAPDAGYMVDRWTVNGTEKTNADGSPYRSPTLTLSALTGSTAVTVTFISAASYTVSASGMDERGGSLGSVAISPAPAGGKLAAGTTVTFTASVPANYLIREWRSYRADGGYTVLQYNVPAYTVASLAADADIRAVFAPVVKYALNFDVGTGSGTITAASGAAPLTSGRSYDANIPIRFTVTPGSGYRIGTVTAQYSGGTPETLSPVSFSGSARVYALTLSGAVTVTANFAAKGSPYTATVTSGSGSGSYYEGDLVSITADPAPAGKVFSGWTSADGVRFEDASAAATTFLMPGKDVTVTANYTAPGVSGEIYTLYFKTNGGSKLDPVTAPKNTVIRLSSYSTARAGYAFDGWYLDAELTQAVTKITLTEDTTVYAKWTEKASEGLLNTKDHIAYLGGYATGEFGPNRNITRAETAMLFYRLLNDPSAGGRSFFPDVEANAWYAEAVQKLAGLGIIAGYADGTFRPNASITRAEFVAMATRFVTLTAEDCSFTDVSRSHWAYGYIAFASSQGWISGYADGSFRPGSSITRAEVAKIVNRMLGRAADTGYVDSHRVRTFPDVGRSYWAYYEIAEASNAHDYEENANGTESWTELR